jgi:hypothetical protein
VQVTETAKIKLKDWLVALALAIFFAHIPRTDAGINEKLDTVGKQAQINELVHKQEQATHDAYEHMDDEERMKGIVYE